MSRGGVSSPTTIDPELGLLRYCRGCDEWWPDDAEFWYFERQRPGARHCRACKAEVARRFDERRRIGIASASRQT